MGARRATGSRVARGRLSVALLGVATDGFGKPAVMGRLVLALAPFGVVLRPLVFAERGPLLADDMSMHSSWQILILRSIPLRRGTGNAHGLIGTSECHQRACLTDYHSQMLPDFLSLATF